MGTNTLREFAYAAFSFCKDVNPKGVDRTVWNQWAVPREIVTTYGLQPGHKLLVTILVENVIIDCGQCNFGVSNFFYIGQENERKLKDAISETQCEVIDFCIEIRAKEKTPSKTKSNKPNKRLVITVVFDRSQAVIASVLKRADGTCENCRLPAPFTRRTNGEPYLEVHHKVPLAENGDDTVENAQALCPNCHRRAHHG
ncbi:hypothetical protein CS379_21425 [Methylobacterium frigidaeris]|nr:hypothetical protein CS379_21425 [Methylobacterium frigidaeris]